MVSFSDAYLIGIIATACFLVGYRDKVLDMIEDEVGVKFAWSVDMQYEFFVFVASIFWLPILVTTVLTGKKNE
jgi:hypothetical protein